MSFWNPATGEWYQTYVLRGSPASHLAGAFVNGEMVLYSRDHRTRWTWIPLGDSVRQLAASSTDGVSWVTMFDATYRH